jgi:hypothetical protein
MMGHDFVGFPANAADVRSNIAKHEPRVINKIKGVINRLVLMSKEDG